MTESIQFSKPQVAAAVPKNKQRRSSFRQQLFSTFAGFGLTVAILAAIAYAYSTTQYLRELYIDQALQATENFAQLSELASLYESGDNAEEAAAATLSFPSIVFVSLSTNEDETLLEKGDWIGQRYPVSGRTFEDTGAKLLGTKDNAWHFLAPVYTSTYDSLTLVDNSGKREYIGYVYVIGDQTEFMQSEFEIFRKNLLIGLFGGLLFIVALHFILNKLLAPMNRLASVMEKTREGDTSVRAEAKGPAEIVDMAEVYNKVMDNLADRDAKLMQHTEILESEVDMRTQELVQARDQAVDSSRHKSEFLANISHELRTPLQAILGYSDILHEGMQDECLDEYTEDVDRIIYNATHLLTLINGILDLSKIESGGIDLNLSHARVADIVKRASETLLPLMQQNNNQLQIDVDDPEIEIVVDEIKLLQILLNLGSNAGKFTSDGTITIRIRHSEEHLKIEVEDTGIGMDKEHLKLIFDPFRQIDGSTTREFEGTGLGLSITRRFCEVLGGTIAVTSEIDKGSCFSLTIPLPISADNNQLNDQTV